MRDPVRQDSLLMSWPLRSHRTPRKGATRSARAKSHGMQRPKSKKSHFHPRTSGPCITNTATPWCRRFTMSFAIAVWARQRSELPFRSKKRSGTGVQINRQATLLFAKRTRAGNSGESLGSALQWPGSPQRCSAPGKSFPNTPPQDPARVTTVPWLREPGEAG